MLRKYIRLYFRLSSRSLRTLMEYKMDFLIGLSGFVVTQSLGIILLNIIFTKIPQLNGWNFYEVLFIYAFAQIPRGVDHLLTDNLWIFSRRIVARSEFDRYLLKPINPLFNVISEKFQTDAFGELLIGIVLIIYANTRLNITISFFNIVAFMLLVIFGAVIYTSIKLFFASLAFWVRNSQNILSTFYSLSDFCKYPISIYPKIIMGIITFAVPFAFTAYFPAAYFVNKVNVMISLGGTALASVVCFCVAYLVWCRGINAYESAGN